MMKHVFYSWQSDLPKANNRNFLESCIKVAIKELNLSKQLDIEYGLDKDTLNVMGTPDIPETIFSKIENSKLFIADVSIINSNQINIDRKTPNPNVLIELGYAAKVLGWERIICVFNSDFGKYEDLPFDLKFRRPLEYSLKNKNKTEEKKRVTQIIKSNIEYVETKSTEFSFVSSDCSFLIIESSRFHNHLENNIRAILNDPKLQERYKFFSDDVLVEITDDLEYRIKNKESTEDTDIEYNLVISFTDDNYSYTDIEKNKHDVFCSVFFTLQEKFKQINFRDMNVYIAFEIIVQGYSPSGKGRNYSELSEEITKLIGTKFNSMNQIH